MEIGSTLRCWTMNKYPLNESSVMNMGIFPRIASMLGLLRVLKGISGKSLKNFFEGKGASTSSTSPPPSDPLSLNANPLEALTGLQEENPPQPSIIPLTLEEVLLPCLGKKRRPEGSPPQEGVSSSSEMGPTLSRLEEILVSPQGKPSYKHKILSPSCNTPKIVEGIQGLLDNKDHPFGVVTRNRALSLSHQENQGSSLVDSGTKRPGRKINRERRED